ncbi:MAG: DoxX family protein [Gemmatimonadetes bacterium]|nr:DoxX family protein [Gemmatimonadota bacterium]
MSPTRSLARPLLAGMFVMDGVSTLKSPAGQVEAVRAVGLSEPEKLVKANAATMLVSGLALATGRLPRLSALALAATLVPTTYAGHAFWSESDTTAKQDQRAQFLKNLSLFGGLLIAAADTGGRESLPHKAGRISSRASRKATKKAGKATKAAKQRAS